MPAASVRFEYMPIGDVTRLWRTTTEGVSTEENGYDSRGRLSSTTLTIASRPSHPLVIDYVYDSTLDRLRDIKYPAEYGAPNAPRKSVHYEYRMANRPRDLTFGGAVLVSEIAYNAAGQATTSKLGPGGPRQLSESFGYDASTGRLDRQQVHRGAANLLDLSYQYGSAGQLEATIDNHAERLTPMGSAKGPTWLYSYDALGRLRRLAEPGPSGARPHTDTAVFPNFVGEQWSQTYTYDKFGNRTGVFSGSTSAVGSVGLATAETAASGWTGGALL